MEQESSQIPNAAPIVKEISISGSSNTSPLPLSSATMMTDTEIKAAKNVDGKTAQAQKSSPPSPEEVAQAIQKPEEQTQETPKDDAKELSPKFAKLSRKEKALREKEKALKEKEQQIQTVAQQNQKFQQAIQLAKQNPIAFAKAFGITPEAYIDAVIGSKKQLSPEEQIDLKVNERFQSYQKQLSEEQTKQQEQAINNQISTFKSNVLKPYLEQQAEQYEAIRTVYGDKAHEYVWAVVNEELKTNPRNFTNADETLAFIDAQSQKLENYLTERLTKTKKFGSNVNQPSIEQTGTSSANKTLTNKLTATATGAPSNKGMTREQSLKNAAKWLQSQLDAQKV